MKHTYRRLGIVALLMACVTRFAYANSSWHWISETLPFDILPWVVIVTLVIEIAVLCWHLKGNYLKVCALVIIANLLSFAAPYFLAWYDVYATVGYEFDRFLNHTPSYIIGLYYGVLTLVVEVPVLYNLFKKTVEKKKLLTAIVAVNIFTTAMVFAIERIVCEGAW